MRRIRLLVWLLVGLCAVLFAVVRLAPRAHVAAVPTTPPVVDAAGSPIDLGTAIGGNPPAPGFSLVDQVGQQARLNDFRGHVVVLAFIDSRCTTTCPLTAQMLLDAKKLLGPAAASIRVLAVNTNPDATSVADVKSWTQTHGMTGKWRFFTGPVATLRTLWKEYNISVEVDPNGAITHTDATYVIDSQGRERYLFTTDSSFSGTVPEAHALAVRVASLLPGHVAVAAASTLVAGKPDAATSVATAFTLPALLPGGGTSQVRIGQGGATSGLHLLDFFATWCQACREDLKAVNGYAADVSSQHLPAVIGVDLRVAEPSTSWVRQFISAQGVNFPVALDATGRVMDAYKIQALPYIALVSGSGKVLWHHVGVLSLADLLTQVRKAAAGH